MDKKALDNALLDILRSKVKVQNLPVCRAH